jgi:hypothetical protein
MNFRILAIPLIALSLTACDKAKNLANKASSAVRDKIAEQKSGSGNANVDPELQKLVDQTPEGAVFRKDLPFPTRIEVRTTRRAEMSGRFFQSSAIESKSEIINGTQLKVAKLERATHQVRYTLEQSSFTLPIKEGAKAAEQAQADPLEQIAPSTRPITFRKTGSTWKSEGADTFRTTIISKEIIPVFDDLLVEHSLAPRPLWFSKKRHKPGDQVQVAGETLPMLLAGKGKGEFTIKLESFESVEGHPCGVFTVTGDYTRKKVPDFEGNLTDEDVSIESGKLWLSLIHPIILREELNTIQTFKSGNARGQGTVKVSITRAWKAL